MIKMRRPSQKKTLMTTMKMIGMRNLKMTGTEEGSNLKMR